MNSFGPKRKSSSYTKFMSITDNEKGKYVTSGVVNSDYNVVIGALNTNYKNIETNKTLLWAESHDTFENEGSNEVSLESINKAWSLVANYGSATALYFARPSGNIIGDCTSYDWLNKEVIETNRFHNYFIDSEQEIFSENYNGNYYIINERYNDEKTGLIITSMDRSIKENNISIKVNHIADGVYLDKISGQEFIVKNGVLTGKINKTGIVILYDNEYEENKYKMPKISYSISNQYFYQGGEANVNIEVLDVKEAYYTINDGDKKYFIGEVNFTVNENAIIKVYAKNYMTSTVEFQIGVPRKKEGYWCVAGLNDDILKNKSIYAWIWKDGSEGSFRDVIVEGEYCYIKQQEKDYGMVLAFFEKNVSLNEANWDLMPEQTKNLGEPLVENVVYYEKGRDLYV